MECEIEVKQFHNGEKIEEKAESMKALGPDCSFAEAYSQDIWYSEMINS